MAKKMMSKDELEAKHPDKAWRLKLARISNVSEFLGHCILRESYKIPDDLSNAVTLTEYGSRTQQELITKHHVPPKEAKILCLLSVAYTTPLVDVAATNLDGLFESISHQMTNQDIHFPFTFGRELYDRYTHLFNYGRSTLNYQDTLELLAGTSAGVFQLADRTIGPFGVLGGAPERFLPPQLRLPLYHCSDLGCDTLHRVRLSSDAYAPINEHRDKLARLLVKESPDPWPWGELIADLELDKAEDFDDFSLATLIPLLGDALSEAELRLLLEDRLDHDAGAFRSRLQSLGLRGKASEISQDLGRAQLMQLLLLCSDRELAQAVDRLVRAGTIHIPEGEIRTPVTNAHRTSGTFRLQVQLGHWGHRVQSMDSDVGQLRLKRLVASLYQPGDPGEEAELSWQIREVDGVSPQAKLEEYARSFDPDRIVRRLVFARKANVLAACEQLHVEDPFGLDDEALTASVLWKLGFTPPDSVDDSLRFWQLHERLKQLAQSAGVSALIDDEAVRALASNYFVMLEKFLDDSLRFATWALTVDHHSASRPYSYSPDVDGLAALRRLDEYEADRDSGPERLVLGEKPSLYGLVRGFGSLAGLLKEHLRESDSHRRSEEDYPDFSRYSDLKRFPFVHTIPFLDLIPEARDKIIARLKEVSKGLHAADVNGVRNDQLHFRRSSTDIDRLIHCLGAIELAARNLEDSGFTRLLYRVQGRTGDSWGRRIVTLRDTRGSEISIARPSQYDWLNLPAVGSPQYLMTTARFAEPNEFLRFSPASGSDFARYWSEYPRRRQPERSRSLEAEPPQSTGTVVSE